MQYTQADRKFPSGTRICEICGKEGLLEYMYAMGASWHVTGHHSIASFNCQTEATAQHWGCCPEHAMQALIDCLQHDEHMSVNIIKQKHEQAAQEGKPKFAPEHQKFADAQGEQFYILSEQKQIDKSKG